ncbi:MAG: hypothetical protein QME96_07165, partial [Myxococcota bacterium]|nr:hypothetical protein [Myxococcota bacterium]
MRNVCRAATAVALSVVLAAAPGCEVEPYCIGESCVDVGLPDGAGDEGDGTGEFQPTDDGALPDGVEDGGDAGDADGADAACDDAVNLLTDPANCGRCGNRCGAANALVACAGGECHVTAC